MIDSFSRTNLYNVPRVTFSTLGFETDTQHTIVHFFLSPFTKFELDTLREIYDYFPKVSCLDVIQEPAETLNVLDRIYKNIANRNLKFEPTLHQDFSSHGF